MVLEKRVFFSSYMFLLRIVSFYLLLSFVIFKEILDPDENMLFYCGPAGGTLQAAVPESLTSC